MKRKHMPAELRALYGLTIPEAQAWLAKHPRTWQGNGVQLTSVSAVGGLRTTVYLPEQLNVFLEGDKIVGIDGVG